jgi:hypothetical protein
MKAEDSFRIDRGSLSLSCFGKEVVSQESIRSVGHAAARRPLRNPLLGNSDRANVPSRAPFRPRLGKRP